MFSIQAKLQLGPNSYGETNIEDNLLKRINDLHRARLEPLVKFLPLILDKLLLLMVKPPTFDGHILNVASAAFNSISMIGKNQKFSVVQFREIFVTKIIIELILLVLQQKRR